MFCFGHKPPLRPALPAYVCRWWEADRLLSGEHWRIPDVRSCGAIAHPGNILSADRFSQFGLSVYHLGFRRPVYLQNPPGAFYRLDMNIRLEQRSSIEP
jgi:hypothetical protein